MEAPVNKMPMQNFKFADAPLDLRWRYVRMVWVANVARAMCAVLGLAPMTEYALQDGCRWNRVEPLTTAPP